MIPFGRRLFVHLAYLDDSDTKQKLTKIQVMSGVVLQDTHFKMFDLMMHSIRDELVPEEKLDLFTEFHACELYGGYGVFEGIEQAKRFNAINRLLGLLNAEDTAVVYAAVDIAKARRQVYGSADPLDIAFRICIEEILVWVRNRIFIGDSKNEEGVRRWLETLVLLIVDDCEKKHRDMLQNSFRSLRHPLPSAGKSMTASEQLSHFHDDVFFGDSRYSVGIQLADICSYFIARHLSGDDEIRPFYELIEPHIAYGQLYPDETQFRAPRPLLKTLIGLRQDERKRIPEVRSDDATTNEGFTQRDQGEAGSGEVIETEKAEG